MQHKTEVPQLSEVTAPVIGQTYDFGHGTVAVLTGVGHDRFGTLYSGRTSYGTRLYRTIFHQR